VKLSLGMVGQHIMSVLFKALQKAEKENEQRQTTTSGAGFDPGRLAGSGAIKFAGGRGINWRTAGMAAALVLAAAIGAAFFLVDTSEPPPRARVAMSPPPAAVPGTTESLPVLQPPPGAPAPSAAPAQVAADPTAPVPAPSSSQPVTSATPAASEPAVSAPVASPVPAEAPQPAAPEVAAAPPPEAALPEEQPPAAKEPVKSAKASPPVQPVTPPARKGMPDIAADSPARMLSPPINVQRNEFNLSGVGNAVQVRQVSQDARSNVSAGYDALVRGAYDMSLEFYERALREEPTSILASLGRGAALQKQGKLEEAREAYEKVLRLDPGNREALSNLTVVVGERSPAEALLKLQDLDKEYPSFSPLKAQIGLTYAKLGAMPEALDYLNRALTLSPESVMYLYNAALVLDHMGRSDQAVVAYEKVLASLASGRRAPELSSMEIERRMSYLRAR
jgi:Flp pilus assembly protein TadD